MNGSSAQARPFTAEKVTDEWYDFRVRVLLSADETSYDGGGMGDGHPLAWCREQGAGRVFCTALGHAREAYRDPAFLAHVRGGLAWTARLGQ